MKCPHCRVQVHAVWQEKELGAWGVEPKSRYPANWSVRLMACPACNQAVVRLKRTVKSGNGTVPVLGLDELVHPKAALRPPAPPEVPKALADDFNEACLVVQLSPKASAALARRCLQSLLREQGYSQKDLIKQIEAVLADNTLPAWLSENLDSVRNIGNFAAHPMKDQNSGAILPVEDEEAEWNLEVLDGLFDFYYVQPIKNKSRRDALNAKLLAAGKPPIK